MRYLLFVLAILAGCASGPKITKEYGPWETDRFTVWAITVREDNPKIAEAILNTFKDGELITIVMPVGNYQEGQEVTLTYRKVTTTTCTDKNCEFEDTYEVQ